MRTANEEEAARRLGEMIRRERSGRFTVRQLAADAGIAAGSLSRSIFDRFAENVSG